MLLRVNGRELGPYIDVSEDSVDPINPEKLDPQFVGVPAFAEGQTYIGQAVGNRQWTIPLVLTASDRASLKQLLTDIRNDLVKGAQVEFAHDPNVDSSSYFTLEKGKLDEAYQYFIVTHSTVRATLTLWTRPYAGIATPRTIASLTGTGPQQFSATGILGDAFALGNLEFRVGSAVASAGRVIGFGVHRSASFRGVRQPSVTGADAGQASSTIVGASGAVGSQYIAIPVSPTGASGISFTSYLTPPDAHVGRHRIFMLARSGLSQPISIYAVDRFGAVLGATAQATQTDQTKWQLLDLGEIQVPARASGQEGVPTQQVTLFAGGASGAAVVASPAFQSDGLIYLPLDIAPGLMRTAGGYGQAAGNNFQDNFDRLGAGGGAAPRSLLSSPNAVPGPGIWTSLLDGSGLGGFGAAGAQVSRVTAYGAQALAGASVAALIGSGAALGDVTAQVEVQLINALGATSASGALVEIWGKALPPATSLTVPASQVLPSAYVGARLTLSPSSAQSVALIAASAGNVAVVASAALTASVASAVMGGVKHLLSFQTAGASAQLFLATAGRSGAAILSGSNALNTLGGNPGMYMRTPSYALDGALYLDNFQVVGGGGSAPDITAREWFRFESYPEVRAYQGNASVFAADRAGNFRGVPPRLPPTGSPVASGPMQVVAFQGEVDNFVGNDGLDIRLDAVDRWAFLK